MRVGERLRRAWRGFDLSWLGPLGLVVLFDDRVPELRWFALFFLVYPLQWVRGLVRLVLWNRRRPRNLPPLTLGRVVLYGVSLCLALFNPWIFVQSLLMAAGQLLAGFRTALRPPQRNARVNLAPPFTGVWTVARGGVEPDSSHSWGIPNQRYAYDLFVTDESGRSHEGNGRRPQDYYAFGRPILAPGDGVVVQVRAWRVASSSPRTETISISALKGSPRAECTVSLPSPAASAITGRPRAANNSPSLGIGFTTPRLPRDLPKF